MNEICLSCRKHTKCGRAEHETIGCGYYVPMTNDEWRRTCSTEEFAEFLFIIGEDNWLTDISNRDEIVPHEKDVVEWLKEIHHEM